MPRDTEQLKIAVILLTMDQREKTLRCLESLAAVEDPDHVVWLWDNGSTDGTAEAARDAFPRVRVHRHESNLGVASGRNRAVDLALEGDRPSHLLFLDNDMTVIPDFLRELAAPFAGDDTLAQTTGKIKDMGDPRRLYGAGGCRIRFWRGDTTHRGYGEPDGGRFDEPMRCIPSGGCMLVRTEVFRQLGGFDTTFDPYGPEDLDFGLRAAAAGYHGLYVPPAVVFHESRPGRTFEGGQYTQKYASHRARHWFLFMRRHASPLQKLGFFVLGGPWLLLGLMIREAKKGNLVPALRGLTAGFLRSLRG